MLAVGFLSKMMHPKFYRQRVKTVNSSLGIKLITLPYLVLYTDVLKVDFVETKLNQEC